ncbi:MAG: ATP-binding protein [Clostridiales bacterium]|jgi:predicted AAA+ superfamily ATPase|nr:ATP-binding protein [Clostridiales bacterium]
MEKIGNKELAAKIRRLTLYRKILKDPAMRAFLELLEFKEKDALEAKFFHILSKNAEERGFTGNIYKKYMISLFLDDENVFSMACENRVKDIEHSSIYKMAESDIDVLFSLLATDIRDVLADAETAEQISRYIPLKLAEWDYCEQIEFVRSSEDVLYSIKYYYESEGVGRIGRQHVLTYDETGNKLVPVENYDPVKLSSIVGIEAQKHILMENISAFLAGYPANNVLLTGARGTGKSSCVKALANSYDRQGLRLLEIFRDQLPCLPKLIDLLSKRTKYKFILFMDDLSLDGNEDDFKHLKSILDGGVLKRPENILFFATSNRRHIVKEKWADRAEDAALGDLHNTDTTNEKLALSDRFGITLAFPKPTKDEYLEIVYAIAREHGLDIPTESLTVNAMKWELNQKGYSGRTARQFVDNLMWEINKDRGSAPWA